MTITDPAAQRTDEVSTAPTPAPPRPSRLTANLHLSGDDIDHAATSAADGSKWVRLGPVTLFANDWHALGEMLIRLGHAALIEADAEEQDRADAAVRAELARERARYAIADARRSVADGVARSVRDEATDRQAEEDDALGRLDTARAEGRA